MAGIFSQMRDALTRPIAPVCILFGMAGCAAIPGDYSDITSFVASQRAPGQFREAVQKGDWPAADQIYAKYARRLETEEPTTVAAAVQGIRGEWQGPLQQQIDALRRMMNKADTSGDELAAALKSARGVADLRRRSAILKSGDGRLPPELAKLDELTAPQSMVDFLSPRFARYDHPTQAAFFSSWSGVATPDIERAVVAKNAAVIAKAIRTAKPGKAKELFMAYGGVAASEESRLIEQAFLDRIGKDIDPTLAELVQWSKVTGAPGGRNRILATLQLDGGTAVVSPAVGEIEFPKTAPADFAAALERAGREDVRYLLVADGTLRTVRISLSEPKTSRIKVKTGQRQKANPAYADAVAAVREAREKYANAQQANREAQSQAQQMASQSGKLGAFGAILGSMSGSLMEGSAKGDLDEAERKLRSTPRQIEEPVFEDRDVLDAKETTEDVAAVRFYLVNLRRKTFSRTVEPFFGTTERTVRGAVLMASATEAPKPPDDAARLTVELDKLSERLGGKRQALSTLAAVRQAEQEEFEQAHAKLQRQAAERSAAIKTQATQVSRTATDPVTAAASNGGRPAETAIGTCRRTTAFLRDRLPRLSNPDLQPLVEESASIDLVRFMRDLNMKGQPAHEAIRLSRAQAAEYDRTAMQAVATASATDAFGTSDEAFLAALANGRLNVSTCTGIRNNALCAATGAKIGAITARAVADELACHDRAGSWPR